MAMDTLVSITLAGGQGGRPRDEVVERALGWFLHVEAVCTRFDERSELRRLCARPLETVAVSPLLCEALRLALAMAEITEGAFDPTLGSALAARGYDRDYRTGRRSVKTIEGAGNASYRDVELDITNSTVMLARELMLDLGAVAKGLALDLAARDLTDLTPDGLVVEAGGDAIVRGVDSVGKPWRVGVRSPRPVGGGGFVLAGIDGAVCTSGDYARCDAQGGHHLLDGRTRRPAVKVVSATVVAPTAAAADLLATAALVLGPIDGIDLLRDQGVEGVVVTPTLRPYATPGFARHCISASL